MSDTKPKRMWHADEDGRCHQGCEAWGNVIAGRPGCGLLDDLCLEVFEAPSPASNSTCPFALLADVLCAVKPHEEEDRRCGTCERYMPVSRLMGICDCTSVVGVKTPDGPPWPNCRFWRKR